MYGKAYVALETIANTRTSKFINCKLEEVNESGDELGSVTKSSKELYSVDSTTQSKCIMCEVDACTIQT